MPFVLEAPTGAGFDYEPPVPALEDLREKGLAGGGAPYPRSRPGNRRPGFNPLRLAGRGPDPGRREQAIKYWLNLDDSYELPSPEEAKRRVNRHIDTAAAESRTKLKASSTPLAEGGMTDRQIPVPDLLRRLYGKRVFAGYVP